MIKKVLHYFSTGEILLWIFSVALILIAFYMFGGNGFLSLIASMIGVTSILLNAKGNPVGQLLMIVFSLLYGIISYSFSYYGEMITYLGMTMPMAAFALISWLLHPYKGNRSEVQVNVLHKTETVLIILWTLASLHDQRYIAVTVCFAAFFVNDTYAFVNWQKMKIRQNNE